MANSNDVDITAHTLHPAKYPVPYQMLIQSDMSDFILILRDITRHKLL